MTYLCPKCGQRLSRYILVKSSVQCAQCKSYIRFNSGLSLAGVSSVFFLGALYNFGVSISPLAISFIIINMVLFSVSSRFLEIESDGGSEH